MGGPQQSPANCLAFGYQYLFYFYKSYAKGTPFPNTVLF